MTRRGILFGVGGLLLIAAIVFYFAALPGMLAGDYRDSARPKHRAVQRELRRVFDTFSSETFGVDPREFRTKSIDRYIARVGKVAERARKLLSQAQTAVTDGQEAVHDVDRGALLDVPSWPAIGNDKAKRIAAMERDYLNKARAFLHDYHRLLGFSGALTGFGVRVGEGMAHGFKGIPKNPTSPGQVTGPVERIVATLKREQRVFRERPIAPGERRDRDAALALAAYFQRQLTAFNAAIRARDLAKIKSVGNSFEKGARPYERQARASLRRLLTESRYAREIGELQLLDRRIEAAYRRL